MKKQLLAIAVVTMLLVATLISTVSAATLTSSKVNDKGEVTVTVKIAKSAGVDFTLTFDQTKFTYVSTTTNLGTGASVVVNSNEVANGKVTVGAFSLSDPNLETVEVHFKVKDGAKGSADFEVGTLGSVSETVENSKVTVEISKEGTPTTKPSTKPTTKPSTTVSPTKAPSGELAPTGAPLYVVGIAAIVVAAFVLMVKKAK